MTKTLKGDQILWDMQKRIDALVADVERLKSVVERWEREEKWQKGQDLIATRRSLGLA